MNPIMTGAIAMGFAVASVFFLTFWYRSRDRLFALFALSFFVLAVNRVALEFRADLPTIGPYLFLIRFVAFAVILLAILDKNRGRPADGS